MKNYLVLFVFLLTSCGLVAMEKLHIMRSESEELIKYETKDVFVCKKRKEENSYFGSMGEWQMHPELAQEEFTVMETLYNKQKQLPSHYENDFFPC